MVTSKEVRVIFQNDAKYELADCGAIINGRDT